MVIAKLRAGYNHYRFGVKLQEGDLHIMSDHVFEGQRSRWDKVGHEDKPVTIQMLREFHEQQMGENPASVEDLIPPVDKTPEPVGGNDREVDFEDDEEASLEDLLGLNNEEDEAEEVNISNLHWKKAEKIIEGTESISEIAEMRDLELSRSDDGRPAILMALNTREEQLKDLAAAGEEE